MTAAQQKALAFIRDELARTDGVPPSHEELAAHLGLKAKSGAHRVIGKLIAHGVVECVPGRVRSLRLVDPDLARTSDAALLAEVRRRGLLTGAACHG